MNDEWWLLLRLMMTTVMRLMTDTVRVHWMNQSTFGNTTWIGDDRFVLSLLFPFYLSSSHIFQQLVQVHQTDGQTVGRSLLLFVVTRRSRAPNEIEDGGHHHGETKINHQSGAWSSQDELFATSCMHRTVHFFFTSAGMNVMLTMISLVVKDVVIEKEERELIATPAVATLITHDNIINHSSSSSCSCCSVPC